MSIFCIVGLSVTVGFVLAIVIINLVLGNIVPDLSKVFRRL